MVVHGQHVHLVSFCGVIILISLEGANRSIAPTMWWIYLFHGCFVPHSYIRQQNVFGMSKIRPDLCISKL